jgi:hypothetical protein
MRKAIRFGQVSAIVLTLLLGSGMVAAQAAPVRPRSGAGEAYYLFYRRIQDIHRNCPYKLKFLKDTGTVPLRPYRIYETIYGATYVNGNYETVTYWNRGFSTADRQEWCRQGDFVYEFFGVHKVRRLLTYSYACDAGGDCQLIFKHTGPWRNANWP